jgi:predicted dehydrogenase
VRVLANRHVPGGGGWQASEGAVETFKATGPEPLRRELELFLDAVVRRSRPAVDVQAGLAAMCTVEAAQRSSALGRRVTLAELA